MANRQQMMQQHCMGNVNSHYQNMHQWPFLQAKSPQCNPQIIREMKILQPLLQDSVQKKSCKQRGDALYIVKGPLTWRQFHRLAGRGTFFFSFLIYKR